MALIRHEDDEEVALREREGYVDNSTEENGEYHGTSQCGPALTLLERCTSRRIPESRRTCRGNGC